MKDNLQRQRDDFQLFYNNVVTTSNTIAFVQDPKLVKQRRVPVRFQHGDYEQHQFQSAEESYHAGYFEAIDACILQLNERFNQEIYSVLMNIETALINSANGEKFKFDDIVKRLYKVDLDFEQLLTGIISQRLPEVKNVTSINTIISLFNPEENTASQMIFAITNVVRLLGPVVRSPDKLSTG